MIQTIRTTEKICSLPAIPTHEWAAQAANAIATLEPTATVGVLIAQLDPSSQSLIPYSTGVSHRPNASDTQTREMMNQAFFLQDKLERINSLGFDLPLQASQQGLVAPFSLLDSNATNSPLGQAFSSQQLHSPILTVVPISPTYPGFVLIIIMAFEKRTKLSMAVSQPAPVRVDLTTHTLAALLPLLAHKANQALALVKNPKAWLTDREHEILDQLILGHSVRVIADNLDRSTHTVHDHVKNLHKKLHANSRGQLIARALGHAPANAEIHTSQTLHPIVITSSTKTADFAELKPSPTASAKPKAVRQSTLTR